MALYGFGTGAIGDAAIAGNSHPYRAAGSRAAFPSTVSGLARHGTDGSSTVGSGSVPSSVGRKGGVASSTASLSLEVSTLARRTAVPLASAALALLSAVAGEKSVAPAARLVNSVLPRSAAPAFKSASPASGLAAVLALRAGVGASKSSASSSTTIVGIRTASLSSPQRKAVSASPVANAASAIAKRSASSLSRSAIAGSLSALAGKYASPSGTLVSPTAAGSAASRGTTGSGRLSGATAVRDIAVATRLGRSLASLVGALSAQAKRSSSPSSRISASLSPVAASTKLALSISRAFSAVWGRVSAIASDSGAAPGPTRLVDGERVVVFDAYPPSVTQQRVDASGASALASSLRVSSTADQVTIGGHSADVSSAPVVVRGRATKLAQWTTIGLAQRVSRSATGSGRPRVSSTSSSASAGASQVASSADTVTSTGHTAKVERP